jgi:hypothetical protein
MISIAAFAQKSQYLQIVFQFTNAVDTLQQSNCKPIKKLNNLDCKIQ